jgi:molybdopterin synthase catalytic subunit
MAEKKMAEIGGEIQDKWGIEDVAMIHRIGALEIGDISILIAVAAPHRKDTFEACSYAIDRVKQVVPVWKKEIRQDGDSAWAGDRH